LDELTQKYLDSVAKVYPDHAIWLSHQFLDGDVGKPCGMVPDGNVGTVYVRGKWYVNGSKLEVTIKENQDG